MATKLTDLKRGAGFTWGKFIKTYHIAEYDIVAYHPWIYVGGCSTGKPDMKEIEFSCYINGEDICRGAGSLDGALAICIASKHDGANSQAGDYFMRMIKKELKGAG